MSPGENFTLDSDKLKALAYPENRLPPERGVFYYRVQVATVRMGTTIEACPPKSLGQIARAGSREGGIAVRSSQPSRPSA